MRTVIKTATLLAAMTLAAPALAQDIIVVGHGQANDPFWSVVKNGAGKVATDTGANVEYRAPETFDMVAMSRLIDAAVNQKPDGLAVSIPDGDAAFAVDQQQYQQGYLQVAFLALNAQYSLMPGGFVPSGPSPVTQDKAEQVFELSSQGIR